MHAIDINPLYSRLTEGDTFSFEIQEINSINCVGRESFWQLTDDSAALYLFKKKKKVCSAPLDQMGITGASLTRHVHPPVFESIIIGVFAD